jgi:small subunit ribosomal protein S6
VPALRWSAAEDAPADFVSMGRYRRLRKYEFIFILDSTVDDAGVNESLERYAKFIREHGGEVTRQESWGRRRFAYEINKKNEGSYVFLKLRAEAKTIAELNRALRFDERVVRSLIVLDEDAEARNAAAQRQTGPGHREEPAGVATGAVS